MAALPGVCLGLLLLVATTHARPNWPPGHSEPNEFSRTSQYDEEQHIDQSEYDIASEHDGLHTSRDLHQEQSIEEELLSEPSNTLNRHLRHVDPLSLVSGVLQKTLGVGVQVGHHGVQIGISKQHGHGVHLGPSHNLNHEAGFQAGTSHHLIHESGVQMVPTHHLNHEFGTVVGVQHHGVHLNPPHLPQHGHGHGIHLDSPHPYNHDVHMGRPQYPSHHGIQPLPCIPCAYPVRPSLDNSHNVVVGLPSVIVPGTGVGIKCAKYDQDCPYAENKPHQVIRNPSSFDPHVELTQPPADPYSSASENDHAHDSEHCPTCSGSHKTTPEIHIHISIPEAKTPAVPTELICSENDEHCTKVTSGHIQTTTQSSIFIPKLTTIMTVTQSPEILPPSMNEEDGSGPSDISDLLSDPSGAPLTFPHGTKHVKELDETMGTDDNIDIRFGNEGDSEEKVERINLHHSLKDLRHSATKAVKDVQGYIQQTLTTTAKKQLDVISRPLLKVMAPVFYFREGLHTLVGGRMPTQENESV